MFQNHFGEIAALLTALFWTVTAMAFEAAGKRVGALALNLIRLVMGFVFLSLYSWIRRGMILPVDANEYQWFWLLMSGIIGFVLGDLFLFRAFIIIGARISMLIMSLVPPITALIAWLTLGEVMSLKEFGGMFITIVGIALVMLSRRKGVDGSSKIKGKPTQALLGLILALGGAVGQAAGLVLSKKGMGDYDAFAATQIRIIAGIAGFIVVVSLMRRWTNVRAGLKNAAAMKRMALGSFTGPFLGVSFSLLAIQNTNAGVAATIMAIVPVLIIPPVIIINKEKVTPIEVLGAFLSVGGVAVFFI